MAHPPMGAKIPDFKQNDISTMLGGSAGNPAASGVNSPILDAITRGAGATPTPQPNWGSDPNQSVIADPNKQYQPITTGTGTPGLNPNTDISAGVPISNTPSINQQNSPGFGMNSNYTTQPVNPSQIVPSKSSLPSNNSILSSLAGMGMGMGAGG